MALRAVDSAKSAATVWSRQRNLSSIRLRLPEERLPVREARICPGVAPIRRTPSFRQLGQPFDSKRSVEARRSRRRIAPGSRKSQEPARAQRTHNGLARWTGNCGGRRGVYRRTGSPGCALGGPSFPASRLRASRIENEDQPARYARVFISYSRRIRWRASSFLLYSWPLCSDSALVPRRKRAGSFT